MRKLERVAVEAVRQRYAVARRARIHVVAFKRAKEPRLRFDKVALEFTHRLQVSLSKSVPAGSTVVVTTTAPIWQSGKTAAALEEKIPKLLAARRTKLAARIEGNRIQVRVLKGGGSRTAKLVVFVHNHEPGPALLFEVAAALLAGMGPGRRTRWLLIAGPAPLKTLQHVYSALRAETAFKRVLLAGSPRLDPRPLPL